MNTVTLMLTHKNTMKKAKWFLLLDAGISSTLTRYVSLSGLSPQVSDEASTLFSGAEKIVLLISLMILLLVSGLSDFISTSWLNLNEINHDLAQKCVIVGGAIISSRLLQGVYIAVFNGLQKQVLLNSIRAFMASLRALGSVYLLIYQNVGVLGFLIFQLVFILLEAFLMRIKLKVLMKGSRSIILTSMLVESVRKFALTVGLQSLLATALSQVDKILLSKLVSMYDLGSYTFSNLVSSSVTIAASSVYFAVLPKLTNYYSSNNPLFTNDIYRVSTQLIFILVTPFSLLLVFFPSEFVLAWSHNSELSIVTVNNIRLLSIGYFLNSLMYIPLAFCISTGKVSKLLKMNSVMLIIFVPALIILVPIYGTLAASASWAFLNLFYVFFGIYYLTNNELIKINHIFILSDILPSLFMMLLFCSITLYFKSYIFGVVGLLSGISLILLMLYVGLVVFFRKKIILAIKQTFIS